MGAGLGLNLAYLNLPVFAYITRISDGVDEALSAIDETTTRRISNTIWFRELKEIAKVKALDKDRTIFPKKWWINTKNCLWGWLFNILFNLRIAKITSILFTIFLSSELMIGTGQSIGEYFEWACIDKSGIGKYFVLSSVGLVWPMAMVAAGTWVQWRIKVFLQYQLESIGDDAVQEASETIQQVTAAIAQVNEAAAAANAPELPLQPPNAADGTT